jgi:hypothetical protein
MKIKTLILSIGENNHFFKLNHFLFKYIENAILFKNEFEELPLY